MTTVCDGIKENRLINKDQILLYKDNYDSTVDFAYERLKAYFDVISKFFPEDWRKGEDGLLRSNIGIRILFIILRQAILYLKYAGKEGIYKKKDLSGFRDETKKLVNPMLVKLKDMSDKERSDIRKQTAKGPLVENAKKMAWWIREEFEGFGESLIGDWRPPIPSEESADHIRSLLQETEKVLRDFIATELEKLHGDNWWNQGIPPDVQKYADELIKREIRERPFQKQDLLALPPRKKLAYTATGHLAEVIKVSTNWPRFAQTFGPDKEYALAQFKSFANVRDPYSHYREDECDEVTKKLGYWGMIWIRKCIEQQ